TTSHTPLFKGELVQNGSHLNVIGAAEPDAREIDTTLVKRSILVVDSREQALSTYGDIIVPIREKAIERAHIRAELVELLAERRTISCGPDDIILFKYGGIAVLVELVADDILAQTPGITL